jgi:peptidoglycan/LPS O-acetylase OafA/YrhL
MVAHAQIVGTETPTSRSERYWPSLDGLRAVAVLLVIARHADLPGFAGGYVGVDIFFVLSGYLITTVLVAEWDRRQRIALGRFYLRRVLRLYPALVVAVAGSVIIAAVVFGASTRHTMLEAMPPALTYWMNWWAIGRPPEVFGHLWSLSIEEQFYLLWAAFLVVVLRFGKQVALVASGALTTALVVAVAILSSGWSADRLYLGTDARAPQLLIGALAALANSIHPPIRRASLVRAAALAGALFLIPAIAGAYGHDEGSVLHVPYAATLAIAVAAVAIVVCLTNPPHWCTTVLGSRPAVGLGRISYGVYLWHLPLTWALLRVVPRAPPLVIFVLVATTSITVAFASYRLVELRFLRLKRQLA